MKIIKLLIVTALSVCIMTACADSLAENEKYPVEEYFHALSIGLGYNWSEDSDSRVLVTHDGMFFRRMLESIYEMENGEIPHTDGRVKLDFYTDIAAEHFPWDKDTVKNVLTAGGNYDPKDRTISLTDGLGSIREDIISDIHTEGDITEITYKSGTSTYNDKTGEYEFLEGDYTTAVLTVKNTENGYIFISNENSYIDDINTEYLQRYVDAVSDVLVYQWDKNGGELTENTEYLKAAVERYAPMLDFTGYIFAEFDGRARVGDYLTVAGMCLPFDISKVSDILRTDESYNPADDTVAVSSVASDAAPAEITGLKTLADGFEIVYEKQTGRFSEGVLTVKNANIGYYVLESNKILK